MSHLIEQQIAEIKNFISQQTVLQKEIFTLSEASIFLGLSKSALYKLTSERSIPHSKPGKKLIYFNKTDLINWILSNRVPSISEMVESSFQKTKSVSKGRRAGYMES